MQFARLRWFSVMLLVIVLPLFPQGGSAQYLSGRAPDFVAVPSGAPIVLMPVDIELFTLTAGGELEPRADWTEAATSYFHDALLRYGATRGLKFSELTESDRDALSEVEHLHRAFTAAISVHYLRADWRLPAKQDRFEWSMWDAVSDLRQRTGAKYALFTRVRDSYTSGGRAAVAIAMMFVGVVAYGGQQDIYATLVDLETGQIVWMNRVARGHGDLRTEAGAKEVLPVILDFLPVAK